MREIIVIAHDIRSAHNIGSIMRTCEGLGVKKLILSGYSPYPKLQDDGRLPHVVINSASKISKTALGADKYLAWEYVQDVFSIISELKSQDYVIASLEQSPNSKYLDEYKPPEKIALILGSEVEGVNEKLLRVSDVVLEIKMKGKKESFNVAAATAMCLFKLSTEG